jgi:ubiquinol-cytochrome c reductase iron-sulfur subunit
MTTKEIDEDRRKFLLNATAGLTVLGAVGASVPFLSAFKPNKAAEEAGRPITVDLKSLKLGEQKTVIWRGKPIWIIRRRPQAIKKLQDLAATLRDPGSKIPQQPSYTRNIYRSIKPEYLILVGVCTHLGCAPTYRPDIGGVDQGWPGGFFCSCHGSKFDMAGRVFKGVPAPTNLEVPPHRYLSAYRVLIGEDEKV